MARQKSIVKLDGTLGGITFYKSKKGYLAREKGGVSAERIRNDPAFQRTRENNAEFGRAGKAGKVLRNSIRQLLQNINDSRMVSRLTKKMVEVIKLDAVNPRGQRNVIDGEAELLMNFDFNANGKLGNTVYAPWNKTLDRPTGEAGVNFDPFIPARMAAAPGGTTHFKLTAAAMEIDFEAETYVAPIGETTILSWDNTLTAAIDIPLELPESSTHPLFLALGIEFFQEVNGEHYSLKNGTFNALKIIDVIV